MSLQFREFKTTSFKLRTETHLVFLLQKLFRVPIRKIRTASVSNSRFMEVRLLRLNNKMFLKNTNRRLKTLSRTCSTPLPSLRCQRTTRILRAYLQE